MGFAIIKWECGGHSEAIIYQDFKGRQMFACANWIVNDNCYVDDYINSGKITEIVTDFVKINDFFHDLYNYKDNL